MKKGPLNKYDDKGQRKGCHTALKYSAPNRAMLFSFYNHPQPLWVWADRTSISSRKLNLHVDVGGRVKDNIKREVSNLEKGLGKKGQEPEPPRPCRGERLLGQTWFTSVRPPWKSWLTTVRWSWPSLSAHALQILLFGPLTYEPKTSLGSIQIESLQLAPSVGRLMRWHRQW